MISLPYSLVIHIFPLVFHIKSPLIHILMNLGVTQVMSFRATLGARNPLLGVLQAVFSGISRRKLLEMTFEIPTA